MNVSTDIFVDKMKVSTDYYEEPWTYLISSKAFLAFFNSSFMVSRSLTRAYMRGCLRTRKIMSSTCKKKRLKVILVKLAKIVDYFLSVKLVIDFNVWVKLGNFSKLIWQFGFHQSPRRALVGLGNLQKITN